MALRLYAEAAALADLDEVARAGSLSTAELEEPSAGDEDEDAVMSLTAMGFGAGVARRALQAAGGDLRSAAEWALAVQASEG